MRRHITAAALAYGLGCAFAHAQPAPTPFVLANPYSSQGLLGSYCVSADGGSIAAGLAANSPIFSMRYNGTGVALIRRITPSVAVTTAFAAGSTIFDLFVARSYTVSDTGGLASTLTGNNGKRRTSFPSTGMVDFRISNTGTLTAGTRTLDAAPFHSRALTAPTIATQPIASVWQPGDVLYETKQGDYPLVLAPNEGVVLQATVPATGVWVPSMTVCWDELNVAP